MNLNREVEFAEEKYFSVSIEVRSRELVLTKPVLGQPEGEKKNSSTESVLLRDQCVK